MSPVVSVIIPNYNYARFLNQRIDSVLSQTFKDLEIIILDDCSQDNSVQVIEEYRSNPLVKHVVFNETNSGSTFKQWRRGFELARGEFIWIAEADDYAAPTLLEKLLDFMRKDTDIKVGFVNSNWVTPTGAFVNKDYTIMEPWRIYDGRAFVVEHLLKENYIYNASMALFRKDAIAGVNDVYMQFRSCGDKIFWRDLALQGKVLYVCEPLNNFRIHDAKVTTNAIGSGLLFKEEHKFFYMNIQSGLVGVCRRLDVVRYFLRYMENVRDSFVSEEVYDDIRRMWEAERDWHNAKLPLSFRICCWLSNMHKSR